MSQYAIIISYDIIDLFISYFGPEHFWIKGALFMSLNSHSSNTKRCHWFLLSFMIINKMKQQITENKENLYFGIKNCAGVSRVAMVREKNLENEKFSRSGKSQGITFSVREIF